MIRNQESPCHCHGPAARVGAVDPDTNYMPPEYGVVTDTQGTNATDAAAGNLSPLNWKTIGLAALATAVVLTFAGSASQQRPGSRRR